MKLRNISMDNLKRRKARMLFLIIGMVLGISTIVTMFTITEAMQSDVQAKLDEFGANIMVLPETNTLSMSYGGMTIPRAQYDVREIGEDDLQGIWKIKNRENLAIVSPKLLGAIEIDGKTVLVVGANLGEEISLKKWWKLNTTRDLEIVRVNEPSPVDPTQNTTKTKIKGLREDEVIIGSKVAEILGKRTGDVITVKDIEFKVGAIIEETGSQDDSIVFMELKTAQKLLGKEDKITLVEVAAICAGCPVEEISRQITEAIPGAKATAIKQVVAERMQTINQLNDFGLAVGVIVLIIGSFIVFTTMMASVNERTREIGIFRAIGFRRMHIVKIILLEATILSLISGILGYAIGTAGAQIAGPIIAGIETPTPLDPILALGAILLSVFVGISATIYPALKASRIDPSEALRYI